MSTQHLSVSEARRQLSRLLTGVSRTGLTVTITQHGKERAALMGIREYQELAKKAQAFERARSKTRPFMVKGSLELCCSPEELEEELNHIRSRWTAAAHRSATELTHELARQ